MKPILTLAAVVAMVLTLAAPVAAYHDSDETHPFGSDAFERTWARTDKPVADLNVSRTWMWGPSPYTNILQEEYAESPAGHRWVRYFDKSRMEINNPAGDESSLWYVTNGLLVSEMVDGFYQTGDSQFDSSPEPAAIGIAGDPDSGAPTYADIHNLGLRDVAPAAAGAPLITRLESGGTIGMTVNDESLIVEGVTAGPLAEPTQHRVASVFWQFMNSEGLVYDTTAAATITDDLFINPYYATGYPITEAYWSNVAVGGTEQDVLWQCFERRCLTYTPGNDAGWQVEAGNVGQHYYRWRYTTQPATLFFVAIEDGGQSGTPIGCGDSLVGTTVLIEKSATTEAAITNALQKLFAMHDQYYGESGLYNALYTSDLEVASVSISGDAATVALTGQLLIGGECDEPRIEGQLEAVVLQFPGINSVTFTLNGDPLLPVV